MVNTSWYETDTHCVIVLYHNQKKEADQVITAEKKGDTLIISMSSSQVTLRISHEYTVDTTKHYEHKTEILLKKEKGGKRWRNLTDQPLEFERQEEIPDGPPEEPSKDPVLSMFMKIYQNLTDESKREMNRSFVESNGTEISTTPKRDPNTKRK